MKRFLTLSLLLSVLFSLSETVVAASEEDPPEKEHPQLKRSHNTAFSDSDQRLYKETKPVYDPAAHRRSIIDCNGFLKERPYENLDTCPQKRQSQDTIGYGPTKDKIIAFLNRVCSDAPYGSLKILWAAFLESPEWRLSGHLAPRTFSEHIRTLKTKHAFSQEVVLFLEASKWKAPTKVRSRNRQPKK